MTATDDKGLKVSRRGMMRKAALLAGGGVLAAAGLGGTGIGGGARADPPKLAQKTVSYQTTPKGKARCDNCANWQPPNACKKVAGTISPSGWCTIYAPKV